MDWYAQQDPAYFMFYIGQQVILNTTAPLLTTSNGQLANSGHHMLTTNSKCTMPPYIPLECVAQTSGFLSVETL